MTGKYFKITGDGAPHTFSAAIAAYLGSNEPGNGFQCKWLQGSPETGNSGTMRIGGALGGPDAASSTVGYPIPTGGSQFLPSISEHSNRYQLNQQTYWLANGDVADCLMGVD